MNKKILSLVLALVMVLGTFTTVFAEEAKTEKVEKVVGKENKIQYVIDKKFVEGYGDGDYGYDKNIKRSEITKLLVYANGNKELADKVQGAVQRYSDVDTKHWANGVITVGSTTPSKANKLPMLNGYPDGSFKPENDVTYAELAKMLVVLVKEDLTEDMLKEANAHWADQWMTWAAQLGILDDVTVANSAAAANRADAFTMLYNALYKMVEFKRVPANDVVGVLSALSKGKLTLNQDKDQTYTITDETVFVRGYNEKEINSNIVLVKNINNPDYYLGSLVRIITNDKKEVTHILELGNPKELALGMDAGHGRNYRWEGVAKYTAETPWTDVNTLDPSKELQPVLKGWARIGFNGSKTKVNSITFEYANKAIAPLKLTVNSNTKVYVANPYNNQMRQVKDINEAMSLLGYNEARWNYIPNVYAGYDTDGYEASLKGYENDKAPAKVIVFNVVTKAQGGEMLRVIHNSSFAGDVTLENTDGELKDANYIKNINHFPYNYGGLFDVIELKWASYNNTYDIIKTLIDHSDTTLYPVVRVKALKDNNNIVVVDRFGNEAAIYVGDADIFNAKQYKNLKVGDYLQFRNDKDNKAVSSVIDVLSILPADNEVIAKFNESHTIKNILKAVQGNTVVAKLERVDGTKDYYTITVDRKFDLWELGVNSSVNTFYVTDTEAEMLRPYIGKEIVFNVRLEGSNLPWAYNFRLNDGKETPIKDTSMSLQNLLGLIDAANKAYNPDKVTAANLKDAKKDLANIEEAISKLSLGDKAKFQKDGVSGEYGVYHKAINELKQQIANVSDEEAVAAARAKADALTPYTEIVKITEQNLLNKEIKAFNDVVTEVNALSTTAKASTKGAQLIADLNAYGQKLVETDAKVEPSVPADPAVATAK